MRRRPEWRPAAVTVAASVALAIAPLAVAAVVLSQRRWFPSLDVAMIDLRVRDVFSADPPLLGIPGRFGGALDEPGSHPGPLAFYLLAPVYRLFGASTWALQAATLVWHGIAITLAVWIGRRRLGVAGAIAVAAVAVLVVWSFGPLVLTQPWNPYLPATAWLLFVLAGWSVLCGDTVMGYVAVVAWSAAAQMHISYLPAGAVLLITAAVVVARRAPRSLLGPVAVLGVLWVPVVVDQFTASGNLAHLWSHLVRGDKPVAGWRLGVETALARLDVPALVAGDVPRSPALAPSEWRGLVVGVLWAALAAASWRRAPRELRLLHTALALLTLVGAVTMARVVGPLWPYLTVWAWIDTALVAFAGCWSLTVVVAGRRPEHAVRVARFAGAAGLAGLAVASTVVYARGELPDPRYGVLADGLADDTLAAVRAGAGLPDGIDADDAAYSMTISDSLDLGSVGFALFGYLRRSGVDIALLPLYEPFAGATRVRDPEMADAQLVVATGPWVDRWRGVDGAAELAAIDPRTAYGRLQYATHRRIADKALRDAGRDDLAEQVDLALFGLLLHADIPPLAAAALSAMAALGQPAAVFIAPIDARPPR